MRRPLASDLRRALSLGSAAFAVVGLLFAGVFAAWGADMREPRATLLGSGQRVSVLVTAGDARLLIATGDDPTAFGNALAAARHPTTRRIDVLLLAGHAEDLTVSAAARRARGVRYAASLGPLSNAAGAVAAAGAGLPVLPNPREIQLGDGTIVVVETAAGEDRTKTVWRAIIRRGATMIAVVSDGEAADVFPPIGPVSALVVAGQEPLRAWAAIPAPVLAVAGSDRVLTGKKLRQEGAALVEGSSWAIRVHPGEAVPLRFVPDGLEVPREPSQPIPATPATPPDGAS